MSEYRFLCPQCGRAFQEGTSEKVCPRCRVPLLTANPLLPADARHLPQDVNVTALLQQALSERLPHEDIDAAIKRAIIRRYPDGDEALHRLVDEQLALWQQFRGVDREQAVEQLARGEADLTFRPDGTPELRMFQTGVQGLENLSPDQRQQVEKELLAALREGKSPGRIELKINGTRRGCFAGLLAGAALFLALLALATLRATPVEPLRLRVLAYNIHHGEGTDGKIDLERIAKVIRDAKPDLVALNEVDRGVKRTKQVDQPKELARLTAMQVIFERNIVYQGGDYGNAVLSRFPVKRHKNHPLPSHYKGEQRGVLEVEVELARTHEGESSNLRGGRPVLFLATHLDYRPGDQERQASVKKIEEIIGDRVKTPILLAGDLNATPDSEVLRNFRKTWTVAQVAQADVKLLSYPSKEPAKQIDYVLFCPAERWKVIEVRAIDEPVASDHRPVLAVLELGD